MQTFFNLGLTANGCITFIVICETGCSSCHGDIDVRLSSVESDQSSIYTFYSEFAQPF